MNCSTVQDMLSDFTEGKLEQDRMDAIETHLAFCNECQAALKEITTIYPLTDQWPINIDAYITRMEPTLENQLIADLVKDMQEMKRQMADLRKEVADLRQKRHPKITALPGFEQKAISEA